MADYGDVRVVGLSQDTFTVKSDGQRYTKPSQNQVPLTVSLQAKLSAEKKGKIRSWSVWPKIGHGPLGALTDFEHHAHKVSYSKKSRPKTVSKTVDVALPSNEIAEHLVDQCNAAADLLRINGMTDDEIFAKNRQIKVLVEGHMRWDMSGRKESHKYGGTQVDAPTAEVNELTVVCQRDGSGTDAFVQLVQNASLQIDETSALDGSCKLDLEGLIETKKPNQPVKFRYVDSDGNKSDLKAVVTGQNKKAAFQHKYDLAGTGRKTGAVKIAIHGETTESAWSDYSVECRKNAPNNLAGEEQGPVFDAVAVTTLVLPDLMATPLGLSFAGGKQPWGSTVTVTNPGHAAETGVGPKGNLCRFEKAAFRPFNKGDAASGPFKTRVFRDNTLVEQPTFNLEAHDGLAGNGWHKFDIELPQGRSTIKVALDTGKKVTELDETNNVYTVEVDVKFPCHGAGPSGLKGASGADDEGGRKRKFGKRMTDKRDAAKSNVTTAQ